MSKQDTSILEQMKSICAVNKEYMAKLCNAIDELLDILSTNFPEGIELPCACRYHIHVNPLHVGIHEDCATFAKKTEENKPYTLTLQCSKNDNFQGYSFMVGGDHKKDLEALEWFRDVISKGWIEEVVKYLETRSQQFNLATDAMAKALSRL